MVACLPGQQPASSVAASLVGQAVDWRRLFYYARGIVVGVLPAPCVHPEAPGQT